MRQYYTEKTIESNQNTSVLAIRTEKLWEDTKRVDQFIGGTGDFRREGLQVTHGSERFIDQANLSEDASRLWCCVLLHELQLYRNIIERAANLNAIERTSTLSRSVSYCQMNSWSELLEHCIPFRGLLAAQS